METKKPDNIVYTEDNGYNANVLPYATSVGAPMIKVDDVVAWKSRGVHAVNKEFQAKFNQLKLQYESLLQEFEWNELVYNAKFSFEPVIGEIYHLYASNDGSHFLSLIGPTEWKREYIGTFQLNSDKKWVILEKKSF
jgi:hypothetical protein